MSSTPIQDIMDIVNQDTKHTKISLINPEFIRLYKIYGIILPIIVNMINGNITPQIKSRKLYFTYENKRTYRTIKATEERNIDTINVTLKPKPNFNNK